MLVFSSHERHMGLGFPTSTFVAPCTYTRTHTEWKSVGWSSFSFFRRGFRWVGEAVSDGRYMVIGEWIQMKQLDVLDKQSSFENTTYTQIIMTALGSASCAWDLLCNVWSCST